MQMFRLQLQSFCCVHDHFIMYCLSAKVIDSPKPVEIADKLQLLSANGIDTLPVETISPAPYHLFYIVLKHSCTCTDLRILKKLWNKAI